MPEEGRKQGAGLTLREVIVLALVIGLLLALVGPLWPIVRPPRRRIRCLSNLRQIGIALHIYAQDYNDLFPKVRADDPQPSSMQCLGLLYDMYLPDTALLLCPHHGITRAKDLTPTDYEKGVPAQIPVANCSFGYDPDHNPTHPADVAIMADLWGDPGDPKLNHDGDGQNVFYIGSNVQWHSTTKCGKDGDDIFTRGAGGPNDSFIRKD